MNIAIDLDDVVVDIISGISTAYNKKYGTQFTLSDHTSFGFHTIWNCTPTEAMNEVYEFYNSPDMEDLQPVAGALDSIRILHQNHTLVFITSRPTVIEDKTHTWIKKHLATLSIPIYHTNQFSAETEAKVTKSSICKKLSVEIIVEDSPINTEDCASAGIKVLLFDRPWNKEVANSNTITRVKNWDEILEKINELSA
jgi:uncharacterized HAD superfamily protein